MIAPDSTDYSRSLIRELHYRSIDPDAGIVIREPDVGEVGYWVGSPGAMWDPGTKSYYLTYRRRRPPGDTPGRGYLSLVARSSDGVHFEDIAAISQDQLDTQSIERSCLRRLDGSWVWYLGYVDPADSRWRIDMVSAPTIDALDVASLRPVLTAESTGTEGVKDPYVMTVGPTLLMFASYAASIPMTPEARADAHSTGDIYARGVTTAPTGLATSLDGRRFDWQGTVLDVGTGWDKQQARLNTIIPTKRHYLGLYDGSADADGNYEERCGLAMSFDLTNWLRLTPDGPLYRSPHASGSMRYTDVVTTGPRPLLYYEYARPDGSHDLRVIPIG